MNDSLQGIFECKIAKRGGIVRRKQSYLSRIASLEELKVLALVRNYQLFEYKDQYLICCDGRAQIERIDLSLARPRPTE
jgi:hypothetical protein